MVTKEEFNSQSLHYVRTVGMTTMRGRGFYFPVDSAMSKNGRIYVLSRSIERVAPDSLRITMLNEEGEYFGVFGRAGENDGEFRWPCGIALDDKDRVYVTDEHLHRVSIFSSEGEFINKWGTFGTENGLLNAPSGITVAPDGNLLISDSQNHRVQKFTQNGEFIYSIGAEGDGEGEFNLPWGIATNSSSEIYVADWGNDRIQKFSPDGKFIEQYGSTGRGDGQFVRPSGITINSEGYMYVADWGNERIQILNPHGEFIQKLRGEATDSEWAKDFLNVNVEEADARSRANMEPEFDFFNDDPHEESSHIEKLFWGPVSLLLDKEERLFITETNRHRIQVYKRN
ncbi:MAG: hypothetical protein CL781_02335 [Chloroflexi bacterium]|nr:hypothetical protein [Chloroflexota bacterium]